MNVRAKVQSSQTERCFSMYTFIYVVLLTLMLATNSTVGVACLCRAVAAE
jgi:hypothetical protein